MLDKESFLDHLEALRQTLLGNLAVLAGLLIPSWGLVHFFLPDLLGMLSQWVPGYKFYYLSPLEPFFIELKLTLVTALILGLPILLHQWGKFLAPALYLHEKRLLRGLVLAAVGFFLAGTALALLGVLPLLLRFSAGFATPEWQPMLTFNSLVSMATVLILGFGAIFQLPIVILLLVKSGLLKTASLRKHRPTVLILILTLSAILTPPDVISQCLMAFPAYLFFELSLLIAARWEPRETPELHDETLPACPPEQEPENTPVPEDKKTPAPKQETFPPEQENGRIPSVYTRARRGLRQGRPRRYRND